MLCYGHDIFRTPSVVCVVLDHRNIPHTNEETRFGMSGLTKSVLKKMRQQPPPAPPPAPPAAAAAAVAPATAQQDSGGEPHGHGHGHGQPPDELALGWCRRPAAVACVGPGKNLAAR